MKQMHSNLWLIRSLLFITLAAMPQRAFPNENTKTGEVPQTKAGKATVTQASIVAYSISDFRKAVYHSAWTLDFGNGFSLQGFTEQDIDSTYAYYIEDPTFAKGYVVDNEQYKNYLKGNIEDENRITIKIVDQSKKNQPIGLIAFREVSSHEPILSYSLNKQYWGKGIMAKAINAITPLIFQDPAIKKIKADTNLDNSQSKSVLVKAKFVLVRTIAGDGDYFELDRPKGQ